MDSLALWHNSWLWLKLRSFHSRGQFSSLTELLTTCMINSLDFWYSHLLNMTTTHKIKPPWAGLSLWNNSWLWLQVIRFLVLPIRSLLSSLTEFLTMSATHKFSPQGSAMRMICQPSRTEPPGMSATWTDTTSSDRETNFILCIAGVGRIFFGYIWPDIRLIPTLFIVNKRVIVLYTIYNDTYILKTRLTPFNP